MCLKWTLDLHLPIIPNLVLILPLSVNSITCHSVTKARKLKVILDASSLTHQQLLLVLPLLSVLSMFPFASVHFIPTLVYFTISSCLA